MRFEVYQDGGWVWRLRKGKKIIAQSKRSWEYIEGALKDIEQYEKERRVN